MISRPTSEELMMLVDGELDPARAAEVQALVDADPEARATVEALRTAGEIVSSAALEQADRAGAGGIADNVMRRIDGVADLDVHRRAKSRRTLTIAGAVWAAAGVAAALAFWVHAPKIQPYVTHPEPMAIRSVGDVIAGGVGAIAPAAAEVDAVDFGARAGSIFYVPSDEVKMTAVVWLTDDDATGDHR